MMAFVSLPRTYVFLLKSIFKQKNFLKKGLESELLLFKQRNDGSISNKDFKKITGYYALGVPGILGESLSILRGKSLTSQERFCLTYLGGISGLLDDLFDVSHKEVQHLKEFIFQPENLNPANSYEELLLYCYQQGLSCSKHKKRLQLQALKVYQAQLASLQQLEEFSFEFIDDITYAKGGSSFIFYRLCLDHPLKKEEEKMLYHLGGLMQLGNDIFDLWEDYNCGIKTAATQCTNMDDLRRKFSSELSRSQALVRETSYSKEQITRFLNIITLALSRVFSCLDQFKKLQIATDNRFVIEKYERKQLICDMQLFSNQLSSMKYYLKNI